MAHNGETPRDWKKELEAVYLIFFMAFILEQRYQWASKLSDGIRGWLRRRDEAAHAAPKRLAEGAGDDVDPVARARQRRRAHDTG